MNCAFKNRRPCQITFPRPGQMIIFVKLISDPPLGKTTVIAASQKEVNITVLLGSNRSFPPHGWEVAIWHNFNAKREWEEASLTVQETSSSGPFIATQIARENLYHHLFAVDLPVPPADGHPYAFTFKFRTTATTQDWRWANEQFSTSDGQLLIRPAEKINTTDDLGHYIENLNESCHVKEEFSQSIGARVWSVSGEIQGAGKHDSTVQNIRLGTPKSVCRWFSLVRIWNPWLGPRHGRGKFAPSEDAVVASFLRTDGLHVLLLAVSCLDIVTVFKHDDGAIVVSSRNDNEEKSNFRVIAVVANSFDSAMAAAIYEARVFVANLQTTSPELQTNSKSVDKKVEAKWLENWYDGFNYCTWNALGQDLTEEKIQNALQILANHDINITNLIIDDNWQSLDNEGKSQFQRGWTRFEADSESFPNGLKHMIQNIRSKHPNIQHIAVWHALMGYWGGISPNGDIAREYKTKTVVKKDAVAGGIMTVVDPSDIKRMYDDFYRFLSEAGIDTVKTDAQFFLDILDDAEDRRRFVREYEDAWTINSLKYFSANAISCMSQIPQILFQYQLPPNKPPIMVRNSDDFFPDVPESHPWHVFCNAHNSLFTQYLNVVPDWDMFQTHHPYSSFHAAARCISGGPIYITDEPGKHDINLIKQITAQTPRGHTVILRPSTVGKSTEAYSGFEEQQLLKIGAYSGLKYTGTGLLGVFNIGKHAISDFIKLDEIPGVEDKIEYVLYSYNSKTLSKPMKKADRFSMSTVELDVRCWDILSAYPLSPFDVCKQDQSHVTLKVAVLGLMEKMTGAAAIVGYEIHQEPTGRIRGSVTLKGFGTLGLYISDLSALSIKDDMLITILQEVVPFHLVYSSSTTDVLEVDVATAWKEMKLNSGWSNQVVVEFFIKPWAQRF